MYLNRTSEWKLMTILISRELPSFLIYHGPQSYTHVKSYGRLKSTRDFVFNFERFDKLCAWIEHPSENLWPFEFLEIFHFWILSISIYYVPESDIQVKCYDHFNFSSTTTFKIRASRYIMGLNRIPMSKVMVVWIGLELLCSISSVSIYYVSDSDIRVKIYEHLNFYRTSVFQFRAFWYIMGRNRTPMSKVMVVWTRPELPCSILSVLINYVPKSDIRVKMIIWISQELPLLNFERVDISWSSIVNPCQKLWPS